MNKFKSRIENRLNSILNTPVLLSRDAIVPQSTVDEIIDNAKHVVEYDPKKNRAKGNEDGIKGLVVGMIVSVIMGVFEANYGDIGANNETVVALSIALLISYLYSYIFKRILNSRKIRKLQTEP